MLRNQKNTAQAALCLPMRSSNEDVYQEQLRLHRDGNAPRHEDEGDRGHGSSPKQHRMTTEYIVGSDVLGRITGVATYGLFIKLPNRESGLVIQSEVCWPGEEMDYRQGQEVAVRVISFRPGLGLSLSIKRARHKECFEAFIKKCGVGKKVQGVVTKCMEYGAFVRLAPGVEGLAHYREMRSGTIEKWSVGQEVELVVSSVHHELMRIGLTNMESGQSMEWGGEGEQ